MRVARTILPRFFQEGDSSRAAGLNAGLDILTALGYLGDEERASAGERDVLAVIYDPAASNGLSRTSTRFGAWRGCFATAFLWMPG